MKIKKFNETITTKNFSEMGNTWSVQNKKVYTGTKNLDLKLGSKVIDLLEEYGLGIMSVGTGKWINEQHLLLPDEVNFQEYRVNIGKRIEWKDFLENEGYEEYDSMSEEEQARIEEEYENLKIDSDPCIEFSVFLPNGITDKESAAMSDASVYLKMINDSELKDVMSGGADYHLFFDDVYGVKKFLNLKKIEITNKNLEDLPSISHRLYKDSKAFAMFRELIGDRESQNLFRNWLNLIK
jgi:hypothetical protein